MKNYGWDGSWTDYIWILHGLRTDYERFLDGLWTQWGRTVDGSWKEYGLTVEGLWMDYGWTLAPVGTALWTESERMMVGLWMTSDANYCLVVCGRKAQHDLPAAW